MWKTHDDIPAPPQRIRFDVPNAPKRCIFNKFGQFVWRGTCGTSTPPQFKFPYFSAHIFLRNCLLRSLARPRRNGRSPLDPPRPCADTACGIIFTDYLRIYLCAYISARRVCLRWGPQDAETQLCVFLVHVCKLLRKVAFFSRCASPAARSPPRREKSGLTLQTAQNA